MYMLRLFPSPIDEKKMEFGHFLRPSENNRWLFLQKRARLLAFATITFKLIKKNKHKSEKDHCLHSETLNWLLTGPGQESFDDDLNKFKQLLACLQSNFFLRHVPEYGNEGSPKS